MILLGIVCALLPPVCQRCAAVLATLIGKHSGCYGGENHGVFIKTLDPPATRNQSTHEGTADGAGMAFMLMRLLSAMTPSVTKVLLGHVLAKHRRTAHQITQGGQTVL